MAKLPRVHQKIFAENAVAREIGQFGSAVAGAKKETGDIAEIQALEAWEKGWSEATVSKNRYPAMQERNGIDKVITQQLAYMFQEGIPEWNAETEYSSTGLVKSLDGNKIKLYRSLKDGNVGHLVSEPNWWEEVNLGETKVDKNSSWGFPSNRYIDLELGASGSTYTAPANGWYYLQKKSGANYQYSVIFALKDGETTGETIEAIEYGAIEWTPLGNNGNAIMLKVPKGKKVVINYSLTGATELFRFIYAEGSN